jgi:putative aldouronate transport system substrate-binding protein
MNAEDTAKSAAYNYAGVDPSYVQTSIEVALNDAITVKNVNVGAIAAEEGMGTALGDKRDIGYDKSVIAAPADFDKVWDENMNDYLKAGGQKIKDERKEKWEATFGSSDMLP